MREVKKLMKKIIFFCISTLFLHGCFYSHINLNEGIASFKVQDYRRAFIRLMPEAEKGNADAQYAIGYMYYYGQGVVEDRGRAMYWIKCAAEKGQKEAIAAMQILTA